MWPQLFVRRQPDVLFLSASPIDEVWTRTTALACANLGLKVAVAICGDCTDLDADVVTTYRCHGIKTHLGITFAVTARIRCQLVVTASSGLDRNIFPTRAQTFIHMPHSLASLHMIYPAGAFDGYDMLFAAGRHHEAEFTALNAARGLPLKPALPIGYGKLDVLAAHARRVWQPRHEQQPLILLAPSWGPDNLLEKCGTALALALLAAGYAVIIRPHPLFFLERVPILDVLQKLAAREPHLQLESPFMGDSAIFDASLLIGDYSGTGFEFAALHRRPVVSVDVGLKVVNTAWQQLGLQPVEIACRDSLGPVVRAEVGSVVEAVTAASARCLTDDDAISRFLHGTPGSCGQTAAHAIKQLLEQPL